MRGWLALLRRARYGTRGRGKERPGTLIATMMERAGCGHGSFIETEYEVIPGLVLCARGRPRQQP
ncbi:hypothetical protein [uncultured Bilophila sp.]|uniref:hypothetical protein n=1 Tax=uncultured Bilophila sp. TaxID=529385 RepID=UPI002619DF9D|nr:hypothetical protein [uncultured Bilophila sp.]